MAHGRLSTQQSIPVRWFLQQHCGSDIIGSFRGPQRSIASAKLLC